MSEIKTRVTVDTSQVNSALNQTKSFVRNWASDIKGQVVGAFAAGAVIAAVKQTSDRLGEINDAASRQDYGVEGMQALAIMAKQAGIEIAQLEKLLTSLGDVQVAAINPQSATDIKKQEQLAGIGITPEAANQMTAEQFLKAVVGGLTAKGITNKAGIQNAMPDVFNSKQAAILNSLMSDLQDWDNKLKEFIASGAVVSKEQVRAIDKAADDLELSWTSLKNNMIRPVTALIKTLDLMVVTFNWAVDSLKNILKELKFWEPEKKTNPNIDYSTPYTEPIPTEKFTLGNLGEATQNLKDSVNAAIKTNRVSVVNPNIPQISAITEPIQPPDTSQNTEGYLARQDKITDRLIEQVKNIAKTPVSSPEPSAPNLPTPPTKPEVQGWIDNKVQEGNPKEPMDYPTRFGWRKPSAGKQDLMDIFDKWKADEIEGVNKRMENVKPFNIYSNELLAKGNILGQTRTSNAVVYAQEQLKTMKKQLQTLEKTQQSIEIIRDVITNKPDGTFWA